MSRRHAPTLPGPRRLLAALATAMIALGAVVPGAALAQPGQVNPNDLELRWQALEYRDANGRMTSIPPGLQTTFLPFAGFITGVGPCSEYRAPYQATQRTIAIQPPEIERGACDSESQAVDDAFYAALAAASSLSLEGDILTLYDVIDDPLLTLTAAQIPLDPTIARWELARIGNPDGSAVRVRGVAPELEFLRGGGQRGSLSGRVVGSTGCGSFLGSFRTFDSTMRITDVDYRLTECTEELAQQAEDFIATLAEISDFDVLPAGLSLEDPSGISRLALVPQIDLGSRIWTPTAVLDDAGERLPLSDLLSTSAVQFFGGKAEGQSLCRGFGGNSISSGLALSTDAITPDERDPCPAKARGNRTPPLEVEDAFLEALRNTSSHALRGDELELYDRSGAPIMRLEPQAELTGRTWVLTRMDVNGGRGGGRRGVIEGAEPTATFTTIDVISGDTGAELRGVANDYTAFYSSPGAARIEIETPRRDGKACDGNRSRRKICRQESDFLRLLDATTGYVAKDDGLRLLQGRDTVLWFRPEDPNEVSGDS